MKNSEQNKFKSNYRSIYKYLLFLFVVASVMTYFLNESEKIKSHMVNIEQKISNIDLSSQNAIDSIEFEENSNNLNVLKTSNRTMIFD